MLVTLKCSKTDYQNPYFSKFAKFFSLGIKLLLSLYRFLFSQRRVTFYSSYTEMSKDVMIYSKKIEMMKLKNNHSACNLLVVNIHSGKLVLKEKGDEK